MVLGNDENFVLLLFRVTDGDRLFRELFLLDRTGCGRRRTCSAAERKPAAVGEVLNRRLRRVDAQNLGNLLEKNSRLFWVDFRASLQNRSQEEWQTIFL